MGKPKIVDEDHPKADLHAVHTPEAVSQRLEHGPKHSYLKDFVYGGVDGTVTTFAVVAGVAGAGLSTPVIVVLGVANMVADGFSMAIGNFLGIRAEIQRIKKARRMEEHHIKHVPEGEREEVRQIFQSKGLEGEILEQVVDIITSDHDRWVEIMLQEELGIPTVQPSPWKAGAATFGAFLALGVLPVLPFVLQAAFDMEITHPFVWSSVLTGVAFFLIGALKGRFVEERWIVSGIETLLVGGLAAGLSYGLGASMKSLVDSAAF